MTTGTVVIGYDGSPQSRMAAAWALDQAALTGAPAELLYAYEWPDWMAAASMVPSLPIFPTAEIRRQAGRVLADAVAAARRSHPGVPVTGTTVDTGADLSLIDRSAGAGLIVLGAHGHSAVPNLLGSTTVAVSAHAHCPVVVVRGTAQAHRPVVAGIDETADPHAVLGFAFDTALVRRAPLHVIRAWPPAIGMPSGTALTRGAVPAGIRRPFDELVAGWREKYPEVPITAQAVARHPAAALTDAGTAAQLLVVGSHGRGRLRGLLLGSVGQHLLRHAACPVAVAHEPET
ncbi:universal stress protein [Paractinoplanes atraurantiacus]|uniref:Nucleotide-binding universal stress protein, UspA family n=1 Tax=Paractinoplanes atraurantiacus TaxID=1036182 RepID=A0A285JH84_9ACTN|nr:universal stress protein [Actinoplanes atraurantiacus]SNY59157.1 Nucleotide-binding universal stress protein, UspA family [Actinoplanes atraurantiacus]